MYVPVWLVCSGCACAGALLGLVVGFAVGLSQAEDALASKDNPEGMTKVKL